MESTELRYKVSTNLLFHRYSEKNIRELGNKVNKKGKAKYVNLLIPKVFIYKCYACNPFLYCVYSPFMSISVLLSLLCSCIPMFLKGS